jgi:exonuclease III
MKLQLLLHIVQGLNADSASQRIRNYILPYLRNLDILCLQEHKLHGRKLDDLGSKIWRQAYFFGCEATIAYNHNQTEEGAGKGGSCMLINPIIQHLIHSRGTIGVNLEQWVRFLGLPNGDVAILNVYIPNIPHERIDLWQALCIILPTNCQWIASRDWNIVEDIRDKSTLGGRIIGG